MKNIYIKKKPLFFIIILSLGLFLNGCDSSDDDNITACDTFLACNDATTWKYVETVEGIEIQLYLKLIDNINGPFQAWVSNSLIDCGYAYFGDSAIQFQILENSKDKLVIKVIYEEDEGFETWTITELGDSLKVVSIYYLDEQIIIFDKTSENMDDFIICDDE